VDVDQIGGRRAARRGEPVDHLLIGANTPPARPAVLEDQDGASLGIVDEAVDGVQTLEREEGMACRHAVSIRISHLSPWTARFA